MGLLDTYYTFRFLRLLTQKWENTDAFKYGIIDKNGKPLKKSSDLKKQEERDAYTSFIRLVWKLRRQLEKLPFGQTRLASYASSLWLIKESYGHKINVDQVFMEHLVDQGWKPQLDLNESYRDHLDTTATEIQPGLYHHSMTDQDIFVAARPKPVGKCLGYPIFELVSDTGKKVYTTLTDLERIEQRLDEDAPANAVGTGHIAGAAPGEDPPGPRKRKPDDTFAGCPVYDVDGDTWHKCRLGKPKWKRWNKYLKTDNEDEHIYHVARRKYSSPIIVRHKTEGTMVYLRYAK